MITSNDVGGDYGGAIRADGVDLTFTNTTLSGNGASYGGAINSDDAIVTSTERP